MKRFLRLLFLIPALIGLQTIVYSQTVPVTFRVNMGYQISQGKFNPATEYVDLAGTFNNWGSPVTKLTDSDGDTIYETVINGLTANASVDFKFRINGSWNGREEFPNGGPNRTYKVQPDSNIITVWYNNEVSPTGPPKAGFAANSLTLFENGLVYFSDASSGKVTNWQWTFEGGTPASSTDRNPSVLYAKAGTYGVRLIVSDSTLSDTLVMNNYILVNKREASRTSWWNNSVFYELFVRSFYDSDGNGIGDFKGMTQKLDYLNDGNPDTHDDLGITGIWLMPINPSPSYHGYDVTNYRDVNPAYGNINDMKEFVSEAHKRGIHVIIDFVMNHTSNRHPWFQQSSQNNATYRNFYRWSATNPGYSGPLGTAWFSSASGYYYGVFGSSMPDLNYETQAVKDSMFAAADFWLKDVGVDGFRLDAALYIMETGQQGQNTQATFDFWNEFDQHIKQTKPDAFAVGEAWTNSETILNYVTNNRLDYCFEFDLASSIVNAVNNGDARGLSAQIQKVCNIYPFLQYGTFLTNHDQNRVMSTLQNNSDKAKVAASLYLTFPGIPYLYYGEELGMLGAKPDEQIRTPMQWTGAANAGFTTATPWEAPNSSYTSVNVAGEQAAPSSMLNWYKKLIAIRNQEAALRLGEYEGLTTTATSVMAYMRHYLDRSVLVVVNTGASAQANLTLTLHGIVVKAGTYQAADLLNAAGAASITVDNSLAIKNISVGAYGTLIYSFANGSGTAVDERTEIPKDYTLLQNYPNPFNPATTIRYSIARQSHVELKVFDLLGREVSTLVSSVQTAGEYKVQFDGSRLPSGVYIYTLKAGEFRDSKKLLLLK
jgi:alpha-amylase